MTADTRARRVVAAGALAVAAAAVPTLAVLSGSGASISATPGSGNCLAWFGSRDDGQCISWSNGTPAYIGTPEVSLGGPNSGSPGLGITTGPLLPGQTINIPLG